MEAKDANFRELAGVSVNYDRFTDPLNSRVPHPEFGYGTRGKPARFYCSSSFLPKLEACFAELWLKCPYGRAEVICSAGAYVKKAKMHGMGRAFDLDAIFWSDREFVTLNYPLDPVFYTGVEAVVRKHFGTVLNYNYNVDHRDHFHIDDGTAVTFNKSESRVWFLQSALMHVHGIAVEMDGVWGPETNRESRKALRNLGIDGGLATRSVWLEFLDRTAQIAFEIA
jgi:Extensin-like protein C-terminus